MKNKETSLKADISRISKEQKAVLWFLIFLFPCSLFHFIVVNAIFGFLFLAIAIFTVSTYRTNQRTISGLKHLLDFERKNGTS